MIEVKRSYLTKDQCIFRRNVLQRLAQRNFNFWSLEALHNVNKYPEIGGSTKGTYIQLSELRFDWTICGTHSERFRGCVGSWIWIYMLTTSEQYIVLGRRRVRESFLTLGGSADLSHDSHYSWACFLVGTRQWLRCPTYASLTLIK